MNFNLTNSASLNNRYTASNGSSLMDQARDKTNGTLRVNQVVTVPTHGGLNYHTAMYVCAPGKEEESLKACYKAIFNKAADEKIKILHIPSFSTRNGCFKPAVASRIALNEALEAIKTNKEIKIRFVTYCSKDGKKRDTENTESYRKIFSEFKGQNSQIQAIEGEIQHLIGDLIVIPVGTDYLYPGTIAKAVEITVQQRNKMYKQPCSTTLTSNFILADVENAMVSILKNFDICFLGRVALVSRCFKERVNSNTLWHFIAMRELPKHDQVFTQVVEPNWKNVIKNMMWDLSEENLNCLTFMSKNPMVRAGTYLSEEFIQACQLMKEGKPEDFRSSGYHGKGSHQPIRNNAIDFLYDCIAKKSAFREIIKKYRKLGSEELSYDKYKIPAKELSKKLNILLEKTKAKLSKSNMYR